MHDRSTIISLLLLFGVFTVVFYYLGLRSDDIIILQHNNGIVVTQSNCSTSLKKTNDGPGIHRENTCPDDEKLWIVLSSDADLAKKLFDGANRLYLGNTRFSEGPFEVCDILSRLSKDPKWTSEINSLEAAIVLERIIPEIKLISSADATLESVSKSVKSVSLETVLLNENATAYDCPGVEIPKKVPSSAVIDIILRNLQ